MTDKVRMLVVGVGNMGLSHARAYQTLDGFEIAGFMSRTMRSRRDLPAEFDGRPRFDDFGEALR